MYISQMWSKLEREVTRHTARNSEVGLEPKAVAAGGSLGRALDQAHVFRQEFPMCVHPPTQDAPFPSWRFQVKGQADAAHPELCWGCNICTGGRPRGCARAGGCRRAERWALWCCVTRSLAWMSEPVPLSM